jgi:phosphate transport system ATP-binding protein
MIPQADNDDTATTTDPQAGTNKPPPSSEPDMSSTDTPDQQEETFDIAALGEPARTRGHGMSVNGLRAYDGDNEAVRGVDIDFPANDVTAIIGPSGCGKSTMVRCLNRMHEEIPGARAEGTVTLDDFDVYGSGVDVTAVRRVIGMVFQKPNPFPTMSIFDNVAAGLKLSGTRGDHLRERVHRALRAVGLWGEVKNRLNAPGWGCREASSSGCASRGLSPSSPR